MNVCVCSVAFVVISCPFLMYFVIWALMTFGATCILLPRGACLQIHINCLPSFLHGIDILDPVQFKKIIWLRELAELWIFYWVQIAKKNVHVLKCSPDLGKKMFGCVDFEWCWTAFFSEFE